VIADPCGVLQVLGGSPASGALIGDEYNRAMDELREMCARSKLAEWTEEDSKDNEANANAAAAALDNCIREWSQNWK